MAQHEDDLKFLTEYERELRPPCSVYAVRAKRACGAPADYIVELAHTHAGRDGQATFICRGCYEILLNYPFPVGCARPNCGYRFRSITDLLANPRRI